MATKKETQAKIPGTRKQRAPVEYKDNADRFSQLATKRTKAALRQLRLIGNLSVKSAGYEYTEQQVEHLKKTLRDATETCLARFDKAAKTSEEFSI